MNGNDEVIRLITEMKESLEREIGGVLSELHDMRRDMTTRFDAQDARLERHAALWQTGSRWSSRMDAWAEKIDANASSTHKELAELKDRVRELERRLKDN